MKRNNRIIFEILALVYVLALGCATQENHLEEVKPDGTRRISNTKTTTFFDAKSDLTKLKTSNTDKTQSIGVTGLDQESSGSNVVNLVIRVENTAVKAMVP